MKKMVINFSSFGEVLEAVIMKDHTTGRARGFGFIVFAHPAVAERVIKEKHNIDGRLILKDYCFEFMKPMKVLASVKVS